MSLQRKQQRFLDAVEESFKFTQLTYRRVIATLDAYDPKCLGGQPLDALILDCWVIVDLAKRISTMLNNTPGLKHNEGLQRFLEITDPVPDFRHYIQHLETEASDIASTGQPIWGSVSWAKLQSEKNVSVFMYAPGRLAKCTGIPIVNPVGRTFHGKIDHVELAVKGQVISLSELVRHIEQFGKAFCDAVTSAEKSGQRDANSLIRFEVNVRS